MEEKGLLISRWERIDSGPDRRIYTVTEPGADVLKRGLNAIVKRRQLFDDLIAFYKKRFENTGQGGEQ